MVTADCFICRKHVNLSAVPGALILADEHVVVSHLPLTTPSGTADSVYLGYLFVEPRRHVREIGDLTAEEAASFGQLSVRASAALQQVAGADHVYAAVIGHDVPHLHLHLIPRYPGTPREFWWTMIDQWPDAPRGDSGAVSDLTDRLRAALR